MEIENAVDGHDGKSDSANDQKSEMQTKTQESTKIPDPESIAPGT